MKTLGRCVLLLFPLAMVITTSCTEHVVETSVYVHKSAVESWKKLTGKGLKPDMETEIQSMLSEVNEIYKGNNIDVKILLKKIEFVQDQMLSPSVDGFLDADFGLRQFTYWLDTHDKKFHDLGLLIIGYRMGGPAGASPQGVANIGEICGGSRSVVMVRIQPTFKGTIVMAHEIGHVLGAAHDEFGNTCSKKDEYLMVYSTLLTGNRYKFSTCSKSSIRSRLYELDRTDSNCLNDNQDGVNPKAPRLGSLMSADTACKRHYGSRAHVDRKVYSGSYGDAVCLKLACKWIHWKTRVSKSAYIPTPDGLYCGKNKQCIKGRCVVTSEGLSTVSDTCPFGDQPFLGDTFPNSCGQVDSAQCPKYKDVCCQSCNKDTPEFGKTADDACRKLEGEKSMSLRGYNSTSYQNKVCGALLCTKEQSLVNNKFQYNKHEAPNGLVCGENKRCQDGKCVVSSDGDPTVKDFCPFGDQPWIAGKYKTTCDEMVYRSGCKSWGRLCCGTCKGQKK